MWWVGGDTIDEDRLFGSPPFFFASPCLKYCMAISPRPNYTRKHLREWEREAQITTTSVSSQPPAYQPRKSMYSTIKYRTYFDFLFVCIAISVPPPRFAKKSTETQKGAAKMDN